MLDKPHPAIDSNGWLFSEAGAAGLIGSRHDQTCPALCVREPALMHASAVQTWGNRADAFVRQAELMAESSAGHGGKEAVRQTYEQGMAAYGTACSLSSSEQGDDLPGLLHNWGVGLISMAQHSQVPSSALLLGRGYDRQASCALSVCPVEQNESCLSALSV